MTTSGARIESALTAARQGGSAVIVVRGEAGAGKTTLLDDAVARARGLTVLRTRGADRDDEQRFAGLAELCEPLLDRLERLPGERAAALASAVRPGAAPQVVDRYAVYAGLLDLLTAAAEETPIVVVVDDAHLLDDASAEAIPFIARRLRIDAIALIVATESDDGPARSRGAPARAARPAHARALLSARFGGDLAPSVVERIAQSGQGNPLALLEIPRGLTPEQRRAEAPLDGSLPPSAEWAYLHRIEALPPDTRRALLLAALAGDGERDTVARACTTLGPRPGSARRRGAGRARGAAAPRGCGSVTSWHAPPSPIRPSLPSGVSRTARWPARWAASRACGIRPTPPPGPTTPSPTGSSGSQCAATTRAPTRLRPELSSGPRA